MKKLLCALALFLCGLAQVQQAQALAISLIPRGGYQVRPGSPLLLDIGISGLQSGGLNTELAAFQMDIYFDPDLFLYIAGAPSSWGVGLGDVGDPTSALGFIDATTPGLLHFGEVSLLDGVALDALQGDGFSLGTLAFDTLAASRPAPPYTIILADDILLGDAAGNRIASALSGDQFVILQVPEPASLPLLGVGLAGMAWLGRRRSGASNRLGVLHQ